MPEWSSGFPYFLQFKSEFCNKEFMIWATVRSQSCFGWLYRASPSLAAKNIGNLISVLTIWWCPCVESSLEFLEVDVCYDQCVLLENSISLCPASFCTPSQTCLLLQVFLDFLLLHSSPIWWKGYLFWVLVLEGLVGLHRTVQRQLLQHNCLGRRLELLWYWMVALETERSLCCLWDCIQVLQEYLYTN